MGVAREKFTSRKKFDSPRVRELAAATGSVPSQSASVTPELRTSYLNTFSPPVLSRPGHTTARPSAIT